MPGGRRWLGILVVSQPKLPDSLLLVTPPPPSLAGSQFSVVPISILCNNDLSPLPFT